METQLVTDIQKYSIHDGEGIRTTIFFKGCPLSCIWCHNPETQDYRKQFMWNREKCTGCGDMHLHIPRIPWGMCRCMSLRNCFHGRAKTGYRCRKVQHLSYL